MAINTAIPEISWQVLSPNMHLFGCEFGPDNAIESLVPSPDFIVSRTLAGEVESRYSNDEWDMSAYHPHRKRSVLYFTSTGGKELLPIRIVEEMKWIVYLQIWRREGPPLAVGTIMTSTMPALRRLAAQAIESNQSIASILGSKPQLQEFILKASQTMRSNVIALIEMLGILGTQVTGFQVIQDARSLADKTRTTRSTEEHQQHPPLPTRLYSRLISFLLNEIAEFEPIADQLLKIAVDCSKDALLGRSYETQHKVAKRLGIPFRKRDMRPVVSDLFETSGIKDFCDSRDIRFVKDISNFLTEMQHVCKLLILIYSGQRNEEAENLPFNCLEEVAYRGTNHFHLYGISTKFDGTQKHVIQRWVTSPEGARAVQVAQKISMAIFSTLDKFPDVKRRDHDAPPLFASPTYFSFIGIENGSKKTVAPAGLDLCRMTSLLERMKLEIAEDDLKELENIDMHRAWRNEEAFAVGNLWNLTSHQLRRSLALYCTSSGLVSLPSLRQQLKHINSAMSVYYARGSLYATSIIGEDEYHFGKVYQNTQPESEAISYITNVLLSDEKLFGGHGTFAERRKVPTNGSCAVTLQDYKNTIKLFRRGELAYQETPLGGCTETQQCDRRAMRSIVACIDCRKAVVRASKVDQVIALQGILVSKLNVNSVTWRMEMEDLKVLKKYRADIEERMDS